MPFSVSGKVIHRSGEGTMFGFPTVNIELTAVAALDFGSYAGFVVIEQKRYPAAIYYGPFQPLQLEAHIIDFSEDVYDKTISIECVQRIRGHEVIVDKKQLIEKIKQDIVLAKKCLAALPKLS